jgi:hypothetical protein
MAESAVRWLVRGTIAALLAACLVLAVGWATPYPMADLKPIALQLAATVLLLGLILGLWPTPRLRRAGELDRRLQLSDRLATAWLNRQQDTAMVRLQRSDALEHLASASRLTMRVPHIEAALVVAGGILMLALLVVPSPMEKVLQQMAAEQLATQQAAERIEALRQDAVLVESLTPEQAKRLDELLRRAQQELSHAQTERAAAAVLARAEQELLLVGDPTADAREQALAAMSETLSQEPLARSLGEALQRNDSRSTREAVEAMRERAGSLSEPQRQALSRALQRAANVGRADSRSSNALRDAARAIAAGEQSDQQMQEASVSLEQAMQAAAAEASLRAAGQRLQDVRSEMSQMAQGIAPPDEQALMGDPNQTFVPGLVSGTSVPIDTAALRRGGVASQSGTDARSERSGAGVGGAALSEGEPERGAEASESIFIPGRIGEGPSENDAVQQPFTIRGAPRPYREVLGQYAQTGRDYIDRAAVPSSVRELVRQYFSELEGQ